MTFSNVILGITLTVCALSAGLFYAYSCSVNPGLGRLPDASYLSAMQAINRAILNPVFFLCFIGALLMLPLAACLHYGQGSARFVLLVAAALVYALGTFGITMFGNVPLNEVLDAADLGSASAKTLQELRLAFEGPWNRWHNLRTLAAVVALLLSVAACLLPYQPRPH